MQSIASTCKSGFTLVALLTLALLLAIPLPAGAQDAIDEGVFISVRYYEGVDPADSAELERVTREGFVPIISGSDGFIAYYVAYPTDGSGVTISVFETREQALASNEQARDFIVERLAPLLPNPPRIIEGAVDIGFVELLDGSGEGDASRLHASVRIYDGFEADDLAEFVAIVEDGFLPIMRETEGFFGYYLMHDDAGAVSALSLFDTEASALASNEKARDFVAENLRAYLPNDPVIASGRVGIAVLAGLNDGANLIDDQPVFASVRVYDGVDPNDMDAIVRLTAEGFLPIQRAGDGFIGYFLLPARDTLAAISVFETAEQAAASNDAAREFVLENLAPLLPNAPTIVQGPMDTRSFAHLDDMMMVDELTSLYASLRIYAEVDLTQRAHGTALVNRIFLPLQRETEGFWGYLRLHDGESRSAALSIYDSEANALAANELAAAFVAEYLTDRPDQAPLRVNGRLGIAALADRNEGANLIDDTTMEPVFVSIRVYDSIDPMKHDEIVRLVDPEFLSIMQSSDGFVGYYLLPAADKLVAVSLFDSSEQAAASNEKARDYVAEYMAPLLPNAPTIVEGALDVSTQLYVKLDGTMSPEDMALPLHAALRIYRNFDMARLDESKRLVETILLPAQMEAGGLFSYFSMNDGADTIAGFSVYDSEAGAREVNAIAADFVAEHMADLLPDDPIRINGRLGVAVKEGVLAGVNAAKWEMVE